MITKTFLTAGRAIFTLELATTFAQANNLPPHYTFKIKKKEAEKQGERDAYFISLLTGPNNTSDYTYLGLLNKESGDVILTKASKYQADSWVVKLLRRTLIRVWAGEQKMLEDAGFSLHHEGRCGRCGRVLTVPESVESGLGPECAGKV